MSSNGLDHVNRNEFEQNMDQIAKDIFALDHNDAALQGAINTHAEIAGLHRFILEKFVPKPLLEAAVKEYYELRQREIATATAAPAQA